MKNIERMLFMVILTMFVGTGIVRAQSGYTSIQDPSAFIKKLKETTHATGTMESKFIQEKNLDVISEKLISQGNFLFKQENKLRWEYTTPYTYLIIMNGDKILIKDENKVSRFDASSNKLFSEINSIMLGCIRGTILENSKQFTISYLENTDSYLLKLIPLSAKLKSSLSEIRIFMSKKTMTVVKLEMQEASGDFTKIQFTGLKTNTTISDDLFKIN